MGGDRAYEDRSRLLGMLARGAYKFPELRLGQLIENARADDAATAGLDLFYMSDAELLAALEAYEDKHGAR